MMIQDKVQYILDKYWDRSIPINVHQIAERMGVKIESLPNIGDGDISGKFEIINGIPTCSVRNTDSQQRQRFTLAHELGHYVLNHGRSFRDNTASFNLNAYDQREIDANLFAATLLMPEIVINYLIDKNKAKTIKDLAHILNVSINAMNYRLKTLNFL